MFMYKLIPTKDKQCYKYNNEYYQLESLTEENRYKTTSILESIIGDLQNFILTSVLLQGANDTFKNKDNKQKKEFLCKILNIDHYSSYEKEIVDENKKIKHQIIFQQKLIDTISTESIQSIIETNSLINSNLSTKLTIDKNNLIDIIRQKENEKNILYSTIININEDIQITDDNQKEYILDQIYVDNTKLNSISNDIKINENHILQNEKLIDNLYLLLDEQDICLRYKNDILEIETRRLSLQKNIDDLNKQSYLNQLIKLDTKIDNRCIDNLSNKRLDYNKIIDDIRLNNQLIDNLTLITRKDIIIEENKIYQEEAKRTITKLNGLIKTEIHKKSNLIYKLINYDGSIEGLEEKLDIINKYLSSPDIVEIVKKKEIVYMDYEKFNLNKKELLYEKLNELKINQTNISSSIDDIIKLLDIVLNPTITDNIIINRYNEFIKFETIYNKNLLEKEYINDIINDINYNKIIYKKHQNIDKQIEQYEKILQEINNNSINLPSYDKLQEEINQHIIYKQKNNELERRSLILLEEINKLELIIETININRERQIILDQINNQIELLNIEMNNNKLIEINLDSYKKMNLLKKEQQDKILYINNILTYKQTILDLKNKYNQINQNVDKLNKNIYNYDKNKESLEINNKIKIKIDHIQLELIDLNNKLNMIDKEIMINQNQLRLNEEKIEKINISNIELERLKSEGIIYNYLASMTGVSGIQLYLLNEYLDKISLRINNILEPFIHKNIQLVLNKDKIDMIIIQDEKQIYTLSGMESFMLDLSLIIIINEISQIPKSNIMFIDESISVLDKNRIDNINDLFIFMKEYFNQVFMITHMKQVKSSIVYNLDIKKTNNYSAINNLGNVIDLR